jgi:hypothetical protein
MAQHDFRSSTELTVEEANREHIEAARAAASSSKREAGDLPAPVDAAGATTPRQMPDRRVPLWSNSNYTPTPSLNEAVITSLENFDENDAALGQARNAFSTATELLKKISDARDPLARDTSKTDGQKLLIMAGVTEKQADRAARAFDNAAKSLKSLIQTLDESLNKPLEQTTHTALCQEIRSYVRGLPKDKREAFVNDAVKRGDMQVMQSVLGAPSYLSEISDERKTIWLRQYREKADPVAVQRLSLYRAALERVTQNAPLIHAEFEKAMGGKWSDVRRLRNQVSESDAALAALRVE